MASLSNARRDDSSLAFQHQLYGQSEVSCYVNITNRLSLRLQYEFYSFLNIHCPSRMFVSTSFQSNPLRNLMVSALIAGSLSTLTQLNLALPQV